MAYRSSVAQLVDNLTQEQVDEIVAKARSIVDMVEGVDNGTELEHDPEQ